MEGAVGLGAPRFQVLLPLARFVLSLAHRLLLRHCTASQLTYPN
jgi:hypothetical protein